MSEEETKLPIIHPLVTTNFMKVFILPDAIVLLTREDLGDLYGIRVRFAYNDLDIKISSEYETEDQQYDIFDNFTHDSAVGMLDELKAKFEHSLKPKEDEA